jgi:hypothetical protein
MNKRSRIWAILGAGVLTLGVVGIALAVELKDAHQGITITWDANGVPSNDGGIEMLASCGDITPGEGEVVIHFVQSGETTLANDGGVSANLLDVWFTGAADVSDVPADSIQGNGTNIDWYVLVTVAGDSLTIDTAESNVAGGDDDLRISHICAGGQPVVTPPPTQVVTPPPTQVVTPPPPSPSFFQSQAAETDVPTEPNTATIGSNGTSAPADGAWLLVIALGVLLSSVVVLTPARARTRR